MGRLVRKSYTRRACSSGFGSRPISSATARTMGVKAMWGGCSARYSRATASGQPGRASSGRSSRQGMWVSKVYSTKNSSPAASGFVKQAVRWGASGAARYGAPGPASSRRKFRTKSYSTGRGR